MKLFGFEFFKKANLPQKDQIFIRSVTPSASTSNIAEIPTLNKVGSLSYAQMFAGGRKNFQPAEYDLVEIGKVEDTDSYVRQAFKKKFGLMFKEGIGYSGANSKTLKYCKVRLSQIARASNIPTIDLMKRLALSLIRTSNAYLIKVRDENFSGGRVRVTANGKTLKPIAAYFPAAPETMHVDLDQNTGQIKGWRQLLPNGFYRDYLPENVVHFTIDRREGFFFGVPSIVPAIDDIRALRQIEENIELLLYQHLFPLFHYRVGTENKPAGFTEDGKREIDVVEEQVRAMPAEGAIVTSERHEIKAIGSEGRAVRAEGYLEYFKKRVFAGLGVSSIDMGDGDTTNRATAATLSRALIDTVKDIQDSFETQWNHFVISELLEESTFGPSVLDEENMVFLEFNEIDIQNRQDQEKHFLELFNGNAITHDELRALLHKEPILIPDDPDDQDPTKYPEWFRLNWKLFKEPENLIRAVDEPYSVQAQSAAANRSLGVTSQQRKTAQEEQEESKENESDRDEQTKVTIAKVKSRSISRKDSFLDSSFFELKEDTTNRLRQNLITRKTLDIDLLRSHTKTWATQAIKKLNNATMIEFAKGFNAAASKNLQQIENILLTHRGILSQRNEFLINRLVDSVMNLFARRVDDRLQDVTLNEVQNEYIKQLHISFDSLKYRLDFIQDVELRRVYNYGYLVALRHSYQNSDENIIINYQSNSSDCERCNVKNNEEINIYNIHLENIVPHHANCNCSFVVKKESRS